MLPEYQKLTMVRVSTSLQLAVLGTVALALFTVGQKSGLDVVLATWPALAPQDSGWSALACMHSPRPSQHLSLWLASHVLIFE